MTNYYFAATYGSGSYNSNNYNGTNATSTGTSTAPGGVLANTGFDVLIGVTLACLIIFIALIAKFWKRKPAQSSRASRQVETPSSSTPLV